MNATKNLNVLFDDAARVACLYCILIIHIWPELLLYKLMLVNCHIQRACRLE